MAKSPQQVDPAITARLNESADKIAATSPGAGALIDKLRQSGIGAKKKGPQSPAPALPSAGPQPISPEVRSQLLQQMMMRSKAATPNGIVPTGKGPSTPPPPGGA